MYEQVEAEAGSEEDGKEPEPLKETKLPNELSLLEVDNGLFDNFLPLLEPFEQNIIWCPSAHNYKMPRPAKGLDPRIDKVCEKMDSLKNDLTSFINEARIMW